MPEPVDVLRNWPVDRERLLEIGKERIQRFCVWNCLPAPAVVSVTRKAWHFDCCAFYRPEGFLDSSMTGIQICLDRCQVPCTESPSRNWTWPGSVTDREPYGVLAHELGHHVDWYVSPQKGRYYGNYGIDLRKESGESPLTSYCPNDAEWFAEMFRLFVTNPGLLKGVRPKTFELLCQKFKPVGSMVWESVLGKNVPQRVLQTNRSKLVNRWISTVV